MTARQATALHTMPRLCVREPVTSATPTVASGVTIVVVMRTLTPDFIALERYTL